jgi:monoamine oxidase
LVKDWVHERWIEGCVSSRPPGLLTGYTHAGATPVGRVHWAGTEAATVSYDGYPDGAVRAAERAVAEVRAAI